ncbi:MAG: mitochondrial fission ELM1 family protein [Zavarzinia sp.]|nr:mitochondrial fission ELM1 family protein [Zavarzinia sp.]
MVESPPAAPAAVWCLSEGHAGMETQVVGLAEALGLAYVTKRVRARLPWDWLPGRLWPCPLRAPTRDSDPLTPPWPDIVISTGNVAAPIAVAIKRASGGRCRLVHLQNPKMALSLFDVVVAPRHDRLKGDTVIETRAGLHRVTVAKIAAGARAWEDRFAHLPRPLVGVLLGGSNRRYRLDARAAAELGKRLALAAAAAGAGLAVTPSRRTAPEALAALRGALDDRPRFIWDGKGDNPYFGLLGLADHLVITADSVSMISEALMTGKPVHVARLPGRSRRLGRFVEDLVADGYVRWFEDGFPTWAYTPLDEMPRIAEEVRLRLGL